MTHLTLNTGDAVDQPRSSVDNIAVEILRPLVISGGGPIPNASPFLVRITRDSSLSAVARSGAAAGNRARRAGRCGMAR